MTTWILGAIGLGVALIALIRTRHERLSIRVLSCLVVAVVWLIAHDRWVDRSRPATQRVQVVTTGATLDCSLLRRQLGLDGLPPDRTVEFGRVVAAHGATGLAIAQARWGRAGAVPLVVWTEPIGTEILAREVGKAHGVRTLTAMAAPPIEPADFELRLLTPLRAGRPGAVELRLVGELPIDGTVEVVIDGPAGREVVRHGSAIRASGQADRVDFDVAVAGRHTIRLFATTESGTRVTLVGGVVAGAAPRVAVLGSSGAGSADPGSVAGTGNLVAALAIQGVDAVALAADAVDDLQDLEGFAAVLAATRLGAPTQAVLADFVDTGGGLFVVGDPRDGGALPRPGEPLHRVMPVEVRPFVALRDQERGVGEDDVGDAGDVEDAEASEDVIDRDPPPPEKDRDSDAATAPAGEPPDDSPVVGAIDGAVAPQPGSTPFEVERRQVALVLVIDQSGSMSAEVRDGVTRMDFAKRSAFETAAALDEDDLLSIIAFDATSYELVPLGRRPSREALESMIRKLGAFGTSTQPQTGLRRAKELLIGVEVAAKHVILLTDGEEIGDAYLAASARYAGQIAAAGGTVSVVHIVGSGIGEVGGDLRFVAAVAETGRGQYHHTRDASRVPRIILAEVRRVLGAVGRGGTGDAADPGATDPQDGAGGSADEDRGDPVATGTDAQDADSPESPPDAPTEDVDPPSDPADDQSVGKASESAEPTVDPNVDPTVDPTVDPSANLDDREESTGPDDAPSIEVRAVHPGSPLLVPVPDAGYPKLRGFADVAGRADAQTLLVAGDHGVPLLAFTNRGLGRIGVWTADFGAAGQASWGMAWRDDAAFPARLAQWLSYLLPPTPPLRRAQGEQDSRVLDTRSTLEPAAPTRAELERLRAASGESVVPTLDRFDLQRVLDEGGDELETTSESRAADDAMWGLLAIGLLALAEFVFRRRGSASGARRTTHSAAKTG